MHAVLTYIVLFLSLLMFFVKREHKVCLLIIYMLCFNGVSLPVLGNIISPLFCFFLSELFHYKQYYRVFKKTDIKYPLIILLLGIIILAISSPHIEGANGIKDLFLDQFIRRYGIIFFVIVASLSMKSQKPMFVVTFACLLLLTGFGLLNLVTKHAVYIDWVLTGVDADSAFSDAGAKFTDSDRFRVQSMFANPFDYGYACLMLLLYYLYLLKGRSIGKKIFYIAVACCLFGIVTCGCRTLLACLILGGVIFAILGYDLKSKVRVALSALFVLFTIIIMMPDEFSKQVSFLSSAFTDDQTVGGSSITMRQTQTAAVIYYIQNDMVLGRGYGFFNDDLGWSEGPSGAVDRDLFGLEGVYMNLLLERGIVGLVLYALYWITLIWITCSIYKKARDKKTLALNLSVIGSYLAFANMTGELSSVPITLTLIGLSSGYALKKRSAKRILKSELSKEGEKASALNANKTISHATV